MTRLRWGLIGASTIAAQHMIGAIRANGGEVTAVMSASANRAATFAAEHAIACAGASLDDLLGSNDIDAVYISTTNELHRDQALSAASAGKHVLCEKPIALSVAECRTLIAARDRTGVKIGEAFMVRTHPQWLRARELAHSGEIGELRAILGAFSYFNRDAANIRNILDFGGGAIMDIGCYPIQISRFLFGREPETASALIDRDPHMHTDRLSSVVLGFPSGQSVFTCSTQLVPYQRVQILGTKGRIEIEVPFNPAPDRKTRLFVDNGADLWGSGMRVEEFQACDQYTIQGDVFSQAVRGLADVPTPLEDSIANMAAIEAVFESGRTGRVVRVAS